MVNIVIAYSQQAHNACAMGDTEQDHMQAIAVRVADILRGDRRLNIYVIPRQNTGTDNSNLRESIRLSNAFITKNGGRGLHYEFHSDAGGATGASFLYLTDAGKKMMEPLALDMFDLTPWKDGGLRKRTDLGALNQTIATAGVIEIAPHDKKEQAKWIHENVVMISVRIVNGIYKYLKGADLL